MGEWDVETVEHTFSTGRTGVLRKHASFFQMAHVMDPESGGAIEGVGMGEFTFAVLTSFFVKPRIVAEPELALGENDMWWGNLRDEEIVETLEMWKSQVADSDRFRAVAAGVSDGASGAGVGGKAKPARRARRPARVPGGSDAGDSPS